MDRYSTTTLCALAALAFVGACVAHEAIGHGGACVISGGTIVLLSSSLFRCTPPRVFVDAAGPLASIAVAAAAARYVARVSPGSRRTFAALLLAFGGFWIAGELVSSAITNTDDVAFVLQRFARAHPAFWRAVTGVVGAVLYVAVLRRAGRYLPGGWPLAAAYLTAGVVSCVAAACVRADLATALREGASESFGAAVGLLYLALRPVHGAGGARASMTLPYSRGLVLFTASVIVLFWLTLGRGVVNQ